MEIGGFHLLCPRCKAELHEINSETVQCKQCGELYNCEDGIWRFLLPERREYFSNFMHEYQAIRRAEGRTRLDHQYFRLLPSTEVTDDMAGIWKIRAASYRVFVRTVLAPMESKSNSPLKIVDLGAGNSWLSNRLAERGHSVAAVDLVTNHWDGLGARIHYDTFFLPLQAEFDRLPLFERQCDLVLFNSSFHYSTDYRVSLAEASRVLKPVGKIVIIDTPVYHSAESGRKMVQEREQQFQKLVGFASNSLHAENFLTHARLRELSAATYIQWNYIQPFYGLRWALKPWLYRLMGRREPATFNILVGERFNSR